MILFLLSSCLSELIAAGRFECHDRVISYPLVGMQCHFKFFS